jgi:uncharacterized protein YbbC (DUF1343 family)
MKPMPVFAKVSICTLLFALLFPLLALAQVRCGADQIPELLKQIGGRKTAVLSNQTAMVGSRHLVDTLLSCGLPLVKLFAPEHGFRGKEEAGAKVSSGIDEKTGLAVISLYGERKKPKPEDLHGIEVVVFDIQDAGVRFFTYISSMSLMMEACAEQNIAMIICDRPNPLGGTIDGPVLEEGQRSFVGMHCVPVMHGMTVGEYARMVNGEGWLKNQIKVNLHIIPCTNYNHNTEYNLPIKPSPNLGSNAAIRAYPTLCFFEGTDIISIGRGTERPFERMGNPHWDSSQCNDRFIPQSIPGVSAKPMHEGKTCYGFDLSKDSLLNKPGLHPEWWIKAWQMSDTPKDFFNSFFKRLAGTTQLEQDILNGKSAVEIRASWQADLEAFSKIRSRYLLYP